MLQNKLTKIMNSSQTKEQKEYLLLSMITQIYRELVNINSNYTTELVEAEEIEENAAIAINITRK